MQGAGVITNSYPGIPEPCQPIGCDNGIHVPGCPFEAIDADAGAVLGDVAKCPECGRQTRSYSRGCSWCGFGRPA